MNGHRPFFLPADPRPEEVQNPDPRHEEVQNPDPRHEEVQNPDPRPEEVQNPDPRPEEVQNPDPDVAYALRLLKERLGKDPCRPKRRRRGGGPRPHNVEPTGTAAEYSGFLVVRLSEQLALSKARSTNSLFLLARKLKLKGLQRLLRRHRLTRASSRVVDVKENAYVDRQRQTQDDDCAPRRPRTIEQLESEVAASELPPRYSLEAYWRLDVRDQIGDDDPGQGEVRVDGWQPGHDDTADRIARQLNELVEVDLAYRELAVSDPMPNGAHGDVFAGIQEYLERAPVGIDARWARDRADGDIAGVELVDLEQGWIVDHEELAGEGLEVIHGDNRHEKGSYRGNHGTAVLSEIVARANGVGVVGIAPNVRRVRVTSHYDDAKGTPLQVANAIRQAIPRMSAGDVLLLEVQRSYLPTEVDEADFDAIRLAVAHGIVVVEAAGNGEANLDRYLDEDGEPVLDRRGRHFRESGAIMVGAARADRPHDRFSGPVGVGSNYGSRIDCFGYGNRTVAAGYGHLDFAADGAAAASRAYTDSFGGTSAAAPIVAGAALVVQGMHEARAGVRLSPWEMRAILSSPATGTRQGKAVPGRIGVMPDLKAILRDRLQLVPDLYLRDSVEDTGAVPARRRIGTSPDIIVVDERIPEAQLQQRFGEGSGRENAYVGGGPCAPGTDHFIYLRLRNRGSQAASQPEVCVYWSEVATLVTPDRWNRIDVRAARLLPEADAEVPPGDTLVVSQPIEWAQDEVEGALSRLGAGARGRHLCFVAIVEDPREERMVLPPFHPPYFDWNEFRAFLRDHHNVALRNVHRVDEVPAAGRPVELPFLLSGTPDLARAFDFEIVQRLPRNVALRLDVPAPLAAPLKRRRLWDVTPSLDRTRAQLHLPARPRLGFSRLRLTAGAAHDCRFRVVREGGGPVVFSGHSLAIRQLYRGEEVGRIVWQLGEAPT